MEGTSQDERVTALARPWRRHVEAAWLPMTRGLLLSRWPTEKGVGLPVSGRGLQGSPVPDTNAPGDL